MSINIKNIHKNYGSYEALKDINLEVKTGELLALLGPSGSGKTSLLRIIAGLEYQDQGMILVDEENFSEKHVKDRNVGFVFQHYALFRHMTIFENVAYGLRVKPKKERPTKKEIAEKVTELLELVKLSNYHDRYPSQLSGGQRQRVALARALAVQPKILLLDEPFGALDAKVRKELRRWLRKLHDQYKITSIFVTHDQEEALDVADRVVIMNEGKIEQIGTPEEVYESPANSFVYDFLGSINIFKGRMEKGKFASGTAMFTIQDEIGNEDGIGYVRPYNFIIEKQPSDESSIKSVIRHIQKVGNTVRMDAVRTDLHESLEVELTKEQYSLLQVKQGDIIYVKPKEIRVFS
ncbi:sulfate/molybdate ABC transporter ATP-binding protein [Niallia sp. NCCP-28]|uniref:sulfate/molybdate ABC transporter ATP-binding protein n=1 Tax=Niallia sp. NCCP-28 TaxID=2934712 RepID=UPI002083A9F7|nr:sulfate ABC transporter ATP-binding protein [Niallia sp. NCCP-28]GKU81043.1 sulfate/thiosulfate import ATP-binding protein CysA [Niallia sp. NCCP-28]